MDDQVRALHVAEHHRGSGVPAAFRKALYERLDQLQTDLDRYGVYLWKLGYRETE